MGGRPRPLIGALNCSLVGLYELEWLGMVDAARAHGADLVTFLGRELDDPDDFRGQANAIYELVSGERLDGLIVWTTALQQFVGEERMEAFCRRFEPLPIVSVEQVLPGHPCVLFDDRGGTRAAVEHLIDVHGHRRIGFVRGPVTHSGAELRYRGYLDALAGRGLELDAALVPAAPDWWDPRHPVTAVGSIVDACGQLDAIVTPSDFYAQGVIAGLGARGLRVPDDVAVVGFDDLPNTAHFALGLENVDATLAGEALARAVNLTATPPPLTTLRTPFAQLGSRAVELLLARLRGEAVPDVEMLEPTLIVRRSCGCLTPSVREVVPAAHPTPEEELRESVLRREGAEDAESADRLLAAFVDAVEHGRSDDFLALVDSLARAEAPAGEQPADWRRVASVLRRSIGPRLRSAEQRSRADDLALRMHVLLGEIAEQQLTFAHLIGEKRDEVVRVLGQRLVTALDVDELADLLSAELPRIGIPSCYLALYDPLPPAGAPPTPESLLVLAYHPGGRIDTRRRPRFRSIDLVPEEHLRREEPRSLVVLPLYFKEQQLGFVLFEAGLRIGWIYEALQGQIASALEGSLLVERERRALNAVEEGRRRLEERVAERTAELAQAIADLRDEIAVRERAEQIQAQLEQELRQAQKMEAIGRLAGGVAHDFNNLLVVIGGCTELLLAHLEDEELRSAVEEIQRVEERATALTRQLLTFSRRQVLLPEVVDLNTVVCGVEGMVRRLIGEDVALRLSPAPGLGPVLADPGQVEQVVVNLAVNARDAMAGGGSLTIETAEIELDALAASTRVGVQPGRYVVLSVSDTGVGMDAETQARVFEPFFTTKPPSKGTGLGLATVFGIVQQSGGHVVVASEPGEGSRFDVYLPRAGQDIRRAEAALDVPRATVPEANR
jgi:signal transduction histidine kinase/DNA-binding LacI/PurR family transcriptional regulator